MESALVTVEWTAKADGTVDDILIDTAYYERRFLLHSIRTTPGDPAPTSGYGVTLVNADGLDLLGGAGASRSDTLSEAAIPKINNINTLAPIMGPISLAIADNSVNGAQGTVDLILVG